MWIQWVPLFVIIAFMIGRVLVNLFDRPNGAEQIQP